MNRALILDKIYGILMRKLTDPITMDLLSAELKCSKKSIYKLFGSKSELLQEVHGLYIDRLMELLHEVSHLDQLPERRLIYQVRMLDQSARTFFQSHLFQHLLRIEGTADIVRDNERKIISACFRPILEEMELLPEERKELERTLDFIQDSIKVRYKMPNVEAKLTDAEFLEMLTTFLGSFLRGQRRTRSGMPDTNISSAGVLYSKSALKVQNIVNTSP